MPAQALGVLRLPLILHLHNGGEEQQSSRAVPSGSLPATSAAALTLWLRQSDETKKVGGGALRKVVPGLAQPHGVAVADHQQRQPRAPLQDLQRQPYLQQQQHSIALGPQDLPHTPPQRGSRHKPVRLSPPPPPPPPTPRRTLTAPITLNASKSARKLSGVVNCARTHGSPASAHWPSMASSKAARAMRNERQLVCVMLGAAGQRSGHASQPRRRCAPAMTNGAPICRTAMAQLCTKLKYAALP